MKLNLSILNIDVLLRDPALLNVEWDSLLALCNVNNIGIKFYYKNYKLQKHWFIEESLKDINLVFCRNVITKQRDTIQDDCGCIGFSTINLNDRRVYLTEGVSDFITVKLTHPNYNVLGMTTLSGNAIARSIVLSCFDSIIIVSDNDFNSKENTGLQNARKMLKFYSSYGKKVKIMIPDIGFKDITDQFMFQLKCLCCK